jgi:predicted nucleic acid-binding protein
MSAYADSGLLASLYLEESTSQIATDTVQNMSSKILMTWLTKLEVENAFHRAAFRGKISHDEAAMLISQFRSNILTSAYEHVRPDPDALYLESSRLANLYTQKFGARTLDLLHVAIAFMFGASDFLSLDHRQCKVASTLGLNVLPQTSTS